MRKHVCTAIAILAVTLAASTAVHAQSGADSPTVEGLLQCADECKQAFYFSEHSEAPFAELRSACVLGCGSVPDAFLAGYQRCYAGCRDLFPFIHSQPAEFAGFQKSCILACSKSR